MKIFLQEKAAIAFFSVLSNLDFAIQSYVGGQKVFNQAMARKETHGTTSS